ncbi:hypothetical protein AAC387_Pa03g3760 [Persea americana]
MMFCRCTEPSFPHIIICSRHVDIGECSEACIIPRLSTWGIYWTALSLFRMEVVKKVPTSTKLQYSVDCLPLHGQDGGLTLAAGWPACIAAFYRCVCPGCGRALLNVPCFEDSELLRGMEGVSHYFWVDPCASNSFWPLNQVKSAWKILSHLMVSAMNLILWKQMDPQYLKVGGAFSAELVQ